MRLMKRLLLCGIAWLILCLTGQALAEEKVVRVGYVNVPTYEEGLEGEPKSGFGYEYLQKISYYTGWRYEYVYDSFSSLITKLANGEIDLLGDVSYTAERAETIAFSSYPMGSERYYLFSLLNNERFADADMRSVAGARIGIERNKYSAEIARSWVAEHGLEVTFIEYVNSAALYEGLENGDCDLMVMTDAADGKGYLPVQMLGLEDFYFGVASERTDLLAELDDALTVIQGNKPNYNAIVTEKYDYGTVGASYLNKTEKKWLEEHENTVRIGFLDDNLPYSDYDADTGTRGYVTALVDRMRSQFGITVETKGYGDVYALYDAALAGEVDAFGPAYSTMYLSEQYGIMQTDSIMDTNSCVIFKGNGCRIDRIAVTNTGMIYDSAVCMRYPDAEIILCEDTEACLKAVDAGMADCTFVPASRLNTLRRYDSFSRLNYADMNIKLNICMFTLKGNTGMYSILEKAIALSADELSSTTFMADSYTAGKRPLAEILKDYMGALSAVAVLVIGTLIFLLRKARRAERSAVAAMNAAQGLNDRLETQMGEISELNAELGTALEDAEAASRAKTVFLNNMSHDIRTPLNAILGFTRLLGKDRTDDGKTADYLEKIEASGEYLLSIINNVLDMARIDSGEMTLDEAVCDMMDTSGLLSTMFAGEIRRKGLEISYDEHFEHRYVIADKAKVNQVFINLISNAIKYTPNGGSIRIVSKEIACERPGYATFVTTVTDTGIGMSREFQAHIFEAFTRERNTTESRVIGTGLGMSIVQKLVTLMGGTIEVESEIGRGSTFRVTLTQRIAEDAEVLLAKRRQEPVRAERCKAKRILLAEDNDLNAEIATAILEESGLAVERAEDGLVCFDMLMKAEAGYYDLILMDIQMPNMDGYTATQKIRRAEVPGKSDIPIVALTANAFEEDRRKALSAGMNGHLGKPIDIDELMRVLREMTDR